MPGYPVLIPAELDSLTREGGGRCPEMDSAALERDRVEPADDGRVMPYPADWTDWASSFVPPATELATDAGAGGGGVTMSGWEKMRSRASL